MCIRDREYDTHKKHEKHLKKMTDIENKLNSASHATATASGGKKALIGNAVYVSKRDAASGKMSYTKIEAVNRHVTKETTYYDDRAVSYTHLDVYKRQPLPKMTPLRKRIWSDKGRFSFRCC